MTTKNLPTLAKEHIDVVEKEINDLVANKGLDLPPDYSAANAMKSAYLLLQETVDKDKKPVLETCTEVSIRNTLMDMIIQGLNPIKKQCYFIAYGKKLTCQRSYFGDIALAKRVDTDIEDIVAEPIYEGDTVSYSIIGGKKIIEEHLQTLDSVNAERIKGGYASVINRAGEIKKTEIMSFAELKQSWKQSKTYPVTNDDELKKGSTHEKFTSEMVRRTLIRKISKPIINSSSDAYLRQSVVQTDMQTTEHAVSTEIDREANKEFIDIESGEVVDVEFKPGSVYEVHGGKISDETSQDTHGTTQPPSEKTEPEKSTECHSESKESTGTQESGSSEEFGAENSIDTAMRTAKEEKEQKQAEPKANPKWVADLNKWLDDIKPDLRHACMEKIKEDSFPKLCEEDRDKIKIHYDELMGAEPQKTDPLKREF